MNLFSSKSEFFLQNSDFFENLNIVKSCLLITLIKCLKGQKSLGSLCSVVHSLIVSGAQPTDRPTRSPIELFWTAKNIQIFGKFSDFRKMFRFYGNLSDFENVQTSWKMFGFLERKFLEVWEIFRISKNFWFSGNFQNLVGLSQTGHVSSSIWSNVSMVASL